MAGLSGRISQERLRVVCHGGGMKYGAASVPAGKAG